VLKFFHILILGVYVPTWNVCCKIMAIEGIESITITIVVMRVICICSNIITNNIL